MAVKFVSLVALSFVLTACSAETEDPVDDSSTTENTAPTADAGPDSEMFVSDTFNLDGSNSSDADGDSLTYDWQLISFPADSATSVFSRTSASPTFSTNKSGTYTFELIVNDGTENSSADTVIIQVNDDLVENSAPTAVITNLTNSTTVTAGSTITLSAADSSDPENQSLSYSWSITSKPVQSELVIANESTVEVELTFDVTGDYVISLAVSDGIDTSNVTEITLSVENVDVANTAPTANAGINQNIETSTLVSLSGASSTDPEDDTLTYVWAFTSKPDNSDAVINNVSSATPTFTADVMGSYTISLTVSDGEFSDSDSITITATDANTAPTANAGTNQNVETSTLVSLSGVSSTDPEDDTLTYGWAFTSIPESSGAALNNASSETPTFTADIAGEYVVELTVSDGELTDSDSVTITVSNSNTAPVADAGEDQSVELGAVVTLDASGSSDADGDTLTYAWTEVETPDGSNATLATPATITTTVTPDVVGLYRYRLTVTDEDGELNGNNIRIVVTEVGEEVTNLDLWMINDTDTSDYITGTNGAVIENVQLAEYTTVNSVEYMYVEASGIPQYTITLTQDDIDQLDNRPKLNKDFVGGNTTATAGQELKFGQDIGYNSSDLNCNDTGGDGYWPPGPACPTDQEKENYFPTEPEENDEDCGTGLGAVGLMVNGTSIYNWSDGSSWGDEDWQFLAPVAEVYDVDVCGGHATTTGDYHHHFYTSCLANLLDDDGNEHSPIYGFAADGYPVYGPYESDDVLAVSGWAKRDYGATESAGGCNTPGERTCTMVDVYDVSKGVETSEQGPDIGEEVSSLSNNTFDADDGFFLEDYYYSQLTVTGEQLDQHNGHDTGDGKGYHYHITLELIDDKLTPSFPYTVGPNYNGELPSNSFSRCSN